MIDKLKAGFRRIAQSEVNNGFFGKRPAPEVFESFLSFGGVKLSVIEAGCLTVRFIYPASYA